MEMLSGDEMLEELKHVNPEIYARLANLLSSGDFEEGLVFTVPVERFGVEGIVELVEGGGDVRVMEENRMEYVRLAAHWVLIGAVREQLESFVGGVHEIVGVELLSVFDEVEFEGLLEGS